MPKFTVESPYGKTNVGGNRKPPEDITIRDESPVVKDNPIAGMIKEKPKAKGINLYLSDEVVEALDNLAKQNKSSRSKVAELLLRKTLLDE